MTAEAGASWMNPWLGMHDDGRATRIRDQGARKRPFTDSEIRALFGGRAPLLLHDLMMVAALTGARINAICELRVRDCEGSAFRFSPAKQETRDRRVPIHSGLKDLLRDGLRKRGGAGDPLY